MSNSNQEIANTFICNQCKFRRAYSTGTDEYPSGATIEYCSKGHWQDGDLHTTEEPDVWVDCTDFSTIQST